MNRLTALGVVGCLGIALLGASCQSVGSGGGSVKTLYVGPFMKDGMGVGPMTCLQVKEASDAEYTMFYSPIQGFDYVPGFEYELLVDVTEREPVPADASKYIYTLIKVVSKSPAGLAIDRGSWELSELKNVSGKMVPPVPNSLTYFQMSDGKVTGNAGANNFFGGYELDGSKVRFSQAGSNMMMGTPELMAQETQFMKGLGETVDYLIVGDELRLRNADGQVIIKMKPRIEPTLTSNVWKASGVNNGRGGVSSLRKNTEITIEFSEEGRVSGHSGCNSYSGAYELNGSSITFSPLAGTRMMCAEPEGVMEQETAFLQALEKSKTYSIHKNSLELRDEGGSLQVKFFIEND